MGQRSSPFSQGGPDPGPTIRRETAQTKRRVKFALGGIRDSVTRESIVSWSTDAVGVGKRVILKRTAQNLKNKAQVECVEVQECREEASLWKVLRSLKWVHQLVIACEGRALPQRSSLHCVAALADVHSPVGIAAWQKHMLGS
jgi:hypothetical protein